MLLERKGPFLKFLWRTLNEVIGCYWVCVFVCSLTSPKRLILISWYFEGRYPFGVQMILGKKKLPDCQTVRRKTKKKTLAIILHVIHSNTTENHYNFAAAQPLVSNKMLYLWPIIWKIEFFYLYKQYLIFTILT